MLIIDGNKYINLVWEKLENWYTKLAVFTPNFVVGLLVFLAIYFSSKFFTNILVKAFHKQFPKKTETIPSLIGFFRFLILLLGAFISLEIMGLSDFLWKFIGSLGVAGVIAGVALKDLVSSIFSGILVGVDKAFKVGDYITISNYSGTVQEIGFLTTKIITDDGKKVYIPNQVIFSAPFFNVTASPQRRVIMNFEIPVGQDLEKARNSILDVLKSTDEPVEEPSEVIFTDLKDGNYVLQAKFVLGDGANFLKTRSETIMKINKRLEEENISLAPPQSISINKNELGS